MLLLIVFSYMKGLENQLIMLEGCSECGNLSFSVHGRPLACFGPKVQKVQRVIKYKLCVNNLWQTHFMHIFQVIIVAELPSYL